MTFYSKFDHVPTVTELKPGVVYLFRSPSNKFFERTSTGVTTMYKGRFFRDWVFVYYYHVKLKDGVTYMVKRG